MAKKNGVKMVGAWKKATKVAAMLKKTFEAVRRRHLEWIRDEGVRIVTDHINAADLNWEPLSDSYKKQKAKDGKDTQIYKATGRLIESINGVLVGKDSVFVGIRNGARSETGEDLVMIATVLEYGARGKNIPARPLWLPSMDEVLTLWEETPPAEQVKKELDKI
jgi:hypothetical protein